jgi:hypothetical protein
MIGLIGGAYSTGLLFRSSMLRIGATTVSAHKKKKPKGFATVYSKGVLYSIPVY